MARFKQNTEGIRIVRRTAYEIKQYRRWMKIIPIAISVLALFVVVSYVVAALYSKYGAYTVLVNKYDHVKFALTLSETPDFEKPTVRLNSKANQDITNISVKDLPQDLDNINGEHNGDNYVAYTYYLKNAGISSVYAEYMLYIANMTQNIEKAVRVRLYVNGEYVDYARTRSDGSGPEPNTTEFLTETIIVRKQLTDFKPEDVTKFTVVIWLEGDDPDCVDSVIGGQFKIDMAISVISSAEESEV